MARDRAFAGFWSYVNRDDEVEKGRITRLRARLEESMQLHLGNYDFQIFQDRHSIGWGERWAERIAGSLDDALVMFTIITPAFLNRPACREEVAAFRERQATLQRNDLVLPIYYLKTDWMEEAEERDELGQHLAGLQCEDWRVLRDTLETDPAYGKAIERLAERAVAALKRGRKRAEPPAAVAKVVKGAVVPEVESRPAADTAPAAATPIPTLRVHPFPGRGDFTSIVEAMKAAPAGSRIVIAPGHYRGSLVMDKPLDLIGDGNRDDIVVETEGPGALVFDTNAGLVRNITFRQRQQEPKDYCVWIKQGRLDLEDCDLSSTGRACLVVEGNADPRVRRNRIHDGGQGGILVIRRGRGTFEDNEVFANALAGIEVASHAEPVMRRNRVHSGRSGGLLIRDGARGVYEENEIFGNAASGIEVVSGADPTVRRNRVHGGSSAGIAVFDKGRGTFEENEVHATTLSGVEVRREGAPVMRRNKFYGGKQNAILVQENGAGVFEENEISENAYAGIEVRGGGDPVVRGNTIARNVWAGVNVHTSGRGTFEDNTVRENGRYGVRVASGGAPVVLRNRINENDGGGVFISDKGSGRYERNDLRGNKGLGLQADGAEPAPTLVANVLE